MNLRTFLGLVDNGGGPDACWPFTGSRNNGGYGVATGVVDGISMAHRVSWFISNGPIPDGLYVLHRCDNRPCCNPAHLFLGTLADNNRDCVAKGRHSNGDTPGRKILTDDDVIAIRSIYRSNNVSQREIAEIFGLTLEHVWRVINRKRHHNPKRPHWRKRLPPNERISGGAS